jgi:hypothetical protein
MAPGGGGGCGNGGGCGESGQWFSEAHKRQGEDAHEDENEYEHEGEDEGEEGEDKGRDWDDKVWDGEDGGYWVGAALCSTLGAGTAATTARSTAQRVSHHRQLGVGTGGCAVGVAAGSGGSFGAGRNSAQPGSEGHARARWPQAVAAAAAAAASGMSGGVRVVTAAASIRRVGACAVGYR